MSTTSLLSDFLMSDGVLNAQQEPVIEQPIISPRPSLQTPAQQAAASASVPSQIPPSIWSQLGGALNDQFGASIFGKTLGPTASNPGATFPSIIDIVAVVAGLVLLAGAVFGFDSVRETVIQTAKKGAEVAAA